MFNKKKLEGIDKTLEKKQEEINKSQKKISTLENELKKIKSSNIELTATMDKILDTLESNSFSKEWEEYQKWKEMRDKLPDIEEMFHLKRLKILLEKSIKSAAM